MNTPMNDTSKMAIKPMISFLIPIMLASVLQSIGQVFGMMIVGQKLGVDALAAISAFFPLLFFLISFAVGIGSGSSILIGQSYGGGNLSKTKEIVGVTIAFTTIVSVVVAIFGSVFSENILNWMGTPTNILPISVSYAQILFITLLITFLYMTYTTFMRGVGDSKTPFYSLVVSTILNICLLPILVFGLFGSPKFGLNGAAYATVLSNFITFVLLLVYLHKTKHVLKLDRIILKNIRLKGSILKKLLTLAIPTSINMVSIAMAEVAVITFVNNYGSNATAAYGITNQLVSYIQIPAMSISIAISVFVAQAIGSGNTSTIKHITKLGIKLNYMIGGSLILLVYLFSESILRLFLTDIEAIGISKNLIFITFWGYVLYGHMQSLSATMRATGTLLWPTLFMLMSIWLIEVPTAYFLSHYTNLGINGIWIAYPVSFIFNLTAQSIYHHFIWKNKSLKTLLN